MRCGNWCVSKKYITFCWHFRHAYSTTQQPDRHSKPVCSFRLIVISEKSLQYTVCEISVEIRQFWVGWLSRYSDWLRAGRSGIESWWGRDFPPVQSGPEVHPASCKMGTGSFPGLKCGRGVLLTTHPLLVPRSWKSGAIPVPTLWATPGL